MSYRGYYLGIEHQGNNFVWRILHRCKGNVVDLDHSVGTVVKDHGYSRWYVDIETSRVTDELFDTAEEAADALWAYLDLTDDEIVHWEIRL